MLRRRSLLHLATLLVLACGPSGGSTGPADGAGDAGGLDISLPNVDGELVTPTAESDQDVFVLAFWATWCQPCQQELTKMSGMYATRKERGLQIFAVSIDGQPRAMCCGGCQAVAQAIADGTASGTLHWGIRQGIASRAAKTSPPESPAPPTPPSPSRYDRYSA